MTGITRAQSPIGSIPCDIREFDDPDLKPIEQVFAKLKHLLAMPR